jgi:CubicO group peptidase (beta-lactamase class C family)
MRTSLAFTALALAAATGSAQPVQLRGIDADVERGMKAFEVPGLSLAIVHRDTVILAKGYGTRTIGKNEPVTDRTMFAIGSSSKAFTAALVGMLVDERKVAWDDVVTKHLSWFQMYDPYVTRELTVRDLLTHRSGLDRGDLLWYGSEYDRDEIVRRIRYLEPASSFRSRFGYQNIMYLTAGQIAAHKTGKSWDELIKTRIFTPLGMSESNTSVKSLTGLPDVASPHTRIDNAVRAVPYRPIDNIGPAGSINSNARDMAKWVRFQLDSGRVGGQRLLTAATYIETHMPQTVIRVEAAARRNNPYKHFSSYALGWFQDDYRGREVSQHGGNIDGMSALVAFMPEERVGLVILTNMNSSPLPALLMNTIFDRFLGAAPNDWIAQAKQRADSAARLAPGRGGGGPPRVQGTSPSLALEKYAGVYADSMYGEATVTVDAGKLTAKYGPSRSGTLEHWHYDTFRATWQDPVMGTSLVTFTLGADGNVARMQIQGIAEFRRRAEGRGGRGGGRGS